MTPDSRLPTPDSKPMCLTCAHFHRDGPPANLPPDQWALYMARAAGKCMRELCHATFLRGWVDNPNGGPKMPDFEILGYFPPTMPGNRCEHHRQVSGFRAQVPGEGNGHVPTEIIETRNPKPETQS